MKRHTVSETTWNGPLYKAAAQWLAYCGKELLLVNITTAASPEKLRVLVGKPEVKRPLGRSKHWWENDIKMNLQEVGCGSMDWIRIGKGECGNERSGSTKCVNFSTSWKPVSFSRRTLLHRVSEFLLNDLTLLKQHCLKTVVHWLCYCP
jgi:hypothetical protein